MPLLASVISTDNLSSKAMKPYYLILLIFFSVNSLAESVIPNIEIVKLKDNIFLHKSFRYVQEYGLVSANGLIIIENKQAFIIDTPWSIQDTKKLVNWIKSNGYELKGSISTHSHTDRTTGIKFLNNHSVPTYAMSLTNQILKDNKQELATVSFDKTPFTLANGLIEVFYPGHGHTIDNVVIWLPKSKILFGGCLIRSLDSKSLGYTGEADIQQWSGSIENIISTYPNIATVIPGHGEFGDNSLLQHTINISKSTKSNN